MKRAVKTVLTAASLTASSLLLVNQAASEEPLLSRFYLKGEAGLTLGGPTGSLQFRDNLGNLGVLKNTHPDLGGAFGVGVGAQVTDFLRTEVLFNYRTGSTLNTRLTNFNFNQRYESGLSSYSIMAAGYFDIHTFQVANLEITPNISGLAGVAFNTTGDFTIRTPGSADIVFKGDSSTNFAWGLGAGAGVKLSEKVTLDLGYRYVDLGEFQSGTALISGATGNLQERVEGAYKTHELMMGVRFRF